MSETNGKLFIHTDKKTYLIDDGHRRYVPQIPTFELLFNKWPETKDISAVPVGTPMALGAQLVQAIEGSPVYLLDNLKKRLIKDPDAMLAYSFNAPRIQGYPSYLLECVPDGPPISAPAH